ncbi:tRNA (N6-isopentenyl adenosine(37)-C2)-methylthiotransferase MiaB [Plebeiibacterium sediminum]|uniref:tRNA-2-methylthio-N(6)-dimethylallyladenosine synthase n=1 Tax=Plebeiibacterium sediminum TaxID=2992112 RepID=A0AAE3SDM1_9BACT|nr:tRNA (N6-isopentenyl adenosine(37)-C2)-methylthiotransferase MiaB [Plebeiobacterium sediminum]MCW3785385.1 tRNA (N6-isopentenyl adenosine(37)-C2)-methylthiotransferase MiaB [Plebeiobacterium sediminum]
MKYFLLTLGCQMNLSDSERVASVLDAAGCTKVDNEEDANIIGILACSVRQKAIDKVYNKISKWNKWKNNKNLITFISGCILPADKEKFLKLFDIVFAMPELPQFPKMLGEYGVTNPLSLIAEPNNTIDEIQLFWNVKPKYDSNFEAFIPIQNGCNKFCTYCAVPYTRGREVSRPSQEILDEVRSLAEKGYKSITLLGQNVNSYGLDKKGDELTFPELLEKVGQIGEEVNKEFWVYFTSPHPRDMTDDIFHIIAKYDCLGKQIHFPIQSGDEKVLIKMNRNHSLEKYRKTMQSFRSILPQATVFTDIIVGFTDETEEQFENTRKAMEEFKYNMAYIAMYSPRPGAASYRWEDNIPLEEKKRRFAVLSDELQKHTYEYNKSLVGKTIKVLIREKDRKPGYLSGHTAGKIVIRLESDDLSLIGQIVELKVTGAARFSIEGELVEKTVNC